MSTAHPPPPTRPLQLTTNATQTPRLKSRAIQPRSAEYRACRNPTLPTAIAMATDWPAYARLSTVAPAGQSAASYTTTGDTTHSPPPLPPQRSRNH